MTHTRSELPETDARLASVEAPAQEEDLTSEVLIEEVSIDGMCGVY